MSGGSSVAVTDLRCLGDGVVVAAGVEVAGVSERGGLLLRSEDDGLNWTVLRPDPSLAPVTPWFIQDPRDAGKASRPLYVTGYANVGLIRAMVDWTPSIGAWLVSADRGVTWSKTEPLAPFGTTTSVGADPQPLVAIDAVGSLATVRLKRRLNVLGDSMLVLVRSRDGGVTWTEVPLPDIKGDAYALLSDQQGGVVVVGPDAAGSAVVMRSDDGGDTWTRTFRSAGKSYWWTVRGSMDGVLFLWPTSANAPRGYFRSTDGGRTWTGRSIALLRPLVRIVNAGPQRWVALSVEPDKGAQEAIAWLSVDDGATWSARATGIRRGLNYSAMDYASTLLHLGDGVLIAHAGGSHVARSADGGETWQLVDAALPDRDFGLGAQCTDGKGTVVLANDHGLATRSTDRGLTWRAGHIVGGGKP